MTSLLYTVLLGLIALYVVNRLRSKGNGKPLPPGPKGLPIVGNINDLPKPGILECHHWLKHKDLYGPISSLTVLGQTFIIINDSSITLELMRDRSAIHSSRPFQIFAQELVGGKNLTALTPYNDAWKMHRKNITKIVGTNVSVSVFDRIQEVEAAHFLLNVYDSPDQLFDHIRKEAGSVILKIIYGYTAEPRGKDPLVDLAGKAMENFAEATVPGKWAVDVFPFLRYLPDSFPGAGFKKVAHRMSLQLKQSADQPYQFVKKQMNEDKHTTSFLSQAIESIGSDSRMEFFHKWTALAMFLGGADTTVSSIMTFFLAMMMYPEVQRKAHEELDRVVGSSRLPVNTDFPKLPYIEAIMKETHRWHPVVPMGIPHSSTEEDVCRGYRIPKGAILLANTWWFTHDPAVYPDPMEFRPERHLTTDTHTAEPDPRNWIFGYGRRICPGRYVADNALFITIAQSLAVFNITKPVENGKVVEPQVKFEPGALSHPVPYRAVIKPRSAAHEALIKAVEKDFPFDESDAKELETMA